MIETIDTEDRHTAEVRVSLKNSMAEDLAEVLMSVLLVKHSRPVNKMQVAVNAGWPEDCRHGPSNLAMLDQQGGRSAAAAASFPTFRSAADVEYQRADRTRLPKAWN
ncbi:MAG: hypothetical protein H6821_12155 [Planctomycetaceae bacterium]|nr:hypothetical protein [Planctomycetaceae bacterium]